MIPTDNKYNNFQPTSKIFLVFIFNEWKYTYRNFLCGCKTPCCFSSAEKIATIFISITKIVNNLIVYVWMVKERKNSHWLHTQFSNYNRFNETSLIYTQYIQFDLIVLHTHSVSEYKIKYFYYSLVYISCNWIMSTRDF